MSGTKKKSSPKKTKTKQPTPVDPDRALAASEVLQHIFLNEKNFDLESKIDDPPLAEQDDEGHVWVTVKLHVPRLDIDMWLDGTHLDHPDNQNDGDNE
jgi:hypothetical protein